jgi:hypothetical protein
MLKMLCLLCALAIPGLCAAAAAGPAQPAGLALTSGDGTPLARRQLPLSLEALLQFNSDFLQAHEAAPLGVPAGYDWYARPRKGSWNAVPAGFGALTGWGQAFWTQGTRQPGAYLLLRRQLTLVCHGSARRWSLLQGAATEGAAFRPDYAGNVAKPAGTPGFIESGADAIAFGTDSAYHFWPRTGRSSLPPGELCGMLVLVEARAEPVAPHGYREPHLLLGLGADYWLNKTAPWDNYRSNRDVAIGRLRLLKTQWAWYGLSTASDSDLRRLASEGYDDAR